MDAEKTVAFGHFAAALDWKDSTSVLFHELKSSKASSASFKVTLGSSITAATSFSQLNAESGDRSFRTRMAESVLSAESLCFARYSSLYFAGFVDEGRRANSDLMISSDVADTPSISLSMASLKRTICS